jgi:hypothetical protein
MPSSFVRPSLVPAIAALALAAHAALAAPAPATLPPERRSTLDDQQSVAVTIYNEQLALIKDERRVTLDAGTSRLALRDVSAQMQPQTALLRSLDEPDAFQVLEQNFDFDLLSPAKLLEKSVGRSVRVVKTQPMTGAETIETAQVLAATDAGVVLQIGDRIETSVPGRIVFDSVPPNLRDRPTLVTELHTTRPGPRAVELSYLSGGLGWQADYVAELSADNRSLDLNGWVTLTNRSGTAYPNARLQLVAGDVNRVREEMSLLKARGNVGLADMAAAAPRMSQQALFEYHLYTLERPTTIADNQTKQVALLHATGTPVTKELVLAGEPHYYGSSAGEIGRKLKVGVFVEFDNREAAGLGLPLPKGVVRVYQRDAQGRAQFIGEDRIDHTPKNEKVKLRLGNAFDVTADKKQTDFRVRETAGKRDAHESAYEIVLRNAKDEAVTVTVREPVPGDWTMLQESQRHTKVAAGTASWQVSVPAGGSRTLTYRVLTRY